ncbi:MAG TPA: DUF1080 domain-containing protein [Ohtaekwangia sp.]|nr:DUF1080 domain-containing protein [Ohtaekwangia sp.]
MKNLMLSLLILTLVYTITDSMAQNILTSQEMKEGWVLLFDGKTTDGWRNFNSDKIGSAWKVTDGTLHLDTSGGEKGGDIITNNAYEDFELLLDWKISPCGNSGLIYNVIEDKKYSTVWQTGPEMQILDNTCHPDAKIHKHRAGDLYDLIACSSETVKPAGEWNQVRIVSKNARYEFWLNGTNVVSFTMHDAAWDEMIKKSKFKDMPDFGTAKKGHLSLQDHGDKVWFRNIKIRILK